jgi:AraC-like DNA-binding protein
MVTTKSLSHHIKALPPALAMMQDLGFDPGQCLAGTGLTEIDLRQPDRQQGFTIEQEFRFHRNLLQLSGDPLLGLTLGRAYTVETYGLLGYAFLSAPTLRHAMTIIRNYGPLSFTLFKIDFQVEKGVARMRFSNEEVIPEDLVTYYVDRDLSAAAAGAQAALQQQLAPRAVLLMHGADGHRENYERFFGCPASFDSPFSELRIDASLLDAPMPLRDAETSAVCQQQCQLLLARMTQRSAFVERVRQLIVARPGYFPDIDYVAEKLNMTQRTLRRRLAEEHSGYQQILAEVRYQLAREYLSTSTLPVEEIALLLGYSAPGNFTNAFKRWHGCSPRQFRQENQ